MQLAGADCRAAGVGVGTGEDQIAGAVLDEAATRAGERAGKGAEGGLVDGQRHPTGQVEDRAGGTGQGADGLAGGVVEVERAAVQGHGAGGGQGTGRIDSQGAGVDRGAASVGAGTGEGERTGVGLGHGAGAGERSGDRGSDAGVGADRGGGGGDERVGRAAGDRVAVDGELQAGEADRGAKGDGAGLAAKHRGAFLPGPVDFAGAVREIRDGVVPDAFAARDGAVARGEGAVPELHQVAAKADDEVDLVGHAGLHRVAEARRQGAAEGEGLVSQRAGVVDQAVGAGAEVGRADHREQAAEGEVAVDLHEIVGGTAHHVGRAQVVIEDRAAVQNQIGIEGQRAGRAQAGSQIAGGKNAAIGNGGGAADEAAAAEGGSALHGDGTAAGGGAGGVVG